MVELQDVQVYEREEEEEEEEVEVEVEVAIRRALPVGPP